MDRTLSLYYTPFSSCSQRARLCLEEKGLAYKHEVVNLHGGEAYTPAYMKINPKGQVPALKHGEKIIPDSVKAADYLEATFEDTPKLFPDPTTNEGAFLKEFLEQCRSVNLGVLTYGSQQYPELLQDFEMSAASQEYMINFLKPESVKAKQQMFQDSAEKYPEMRDVFLRKMESFGGINFMRSKEVLLGEIDKVKKLFNSAEEQLKKNADAGKADYWLATQNFTLTDIDLGIILHRLKVVGLAKSTWLDGKHPHVEKYYQKLCARNTFSNICVNAVMNPVKS